jgi:anthranilate phosphoribosyltransferase
MEPGPGWEAMRAILKRVAVGPQGSRDLDRVEAREALRLCLGREASDVQIGVFLIAERLKRETFEENAGFLDALRDASVVRTGPAPEVVCLADPFDGFTRQAHDGPAVAAVLAACGLPAYVVGAAGMPPKLGVTPRQVLEALGARLDLGRGAASVDGAAARLAAGEPAYLDLDDFCPALAALTPIRREIAKRPCLATLEKLVLPLRGQARTHLVSGWVHAGYERLMLGLLRGGGIASALLVKGREGCIDLHLRRPSETASFAGEGPDRYESIDPSTLGVSSAEPPDQDTSPQAVATRWRRALDGSDPAAAQGIRLLAGVVLAQVGRARTVADGMVMAQDGVESGRAQALLEGMK